MDGILQGMNTALHVVLVGAFAMVPGLLFWSFVFGLVLFVRKLRRIDLVPDQQREGTAA